MEFRIVFLFMIGVLMLCRPLCAEPWYAPYHADPLDFVSLKQGCRVEMVQQMMGRSLRHLFTVKRNGSEWVLASVLIDTGFNAAGLCYGVLFKDGIMQKLVDYESVAQFAQEPGQWHTIDGQSVPLYYKLCPWDPLDYTYVDRIIAAPPLDAQSFWRQVNDRKEKDGFSFYGNLPLTLVIAPFAIMEYPRTLRCRHIHSSADMELSGFQFAIGNNVKGYCNLEKYKCRSRRFGDIQVRQFILDYGRMFLRPYESSRFLVLVLKDGIIEAIFNEDSYTNGFVSPSWIED